MTITELEARATARALGRTMVEPCDAITVRVLCSRLREAIRVAKRLVKSDESDLGVYSKTVGNVLNELIERLAADL